MSQSVAFRLKQAANAVISALAVVALKGIARLDPDRMANFAAAFLRTVGPWLPEHRLGRDNLRAAFPKKTPAEIEAILRGVWDNLGRVAAEFAHLNSLWDYQLDHPAVSRIEFSTRDMEIFQQLRDDGKPAFVFAAHLANWELPALAGQINGLDSAIVYRLPNLGGIAQTIVAMRAGHMGKLIASGPEAPFKIARALEAGSHVGMLVDQHYGKGVDVIFFGRRCKANPMLARLAHHFDCPIHGVRVIRLGARRFRGEITEALEVPRDPDGRLNIERTMQAITCVVEGWVREHPEQWLWLHRRWR
jgi:Kdo2-lipid IVA lauroyltransferase/acyltransferase